MNQAISFTAYVLSPLRRLQFPNTNQLLIGFDIDLFGIPVNCIVEDENIIRYLIHNNIMQGSVVRVIGRPLVSFDLCFLLDQQIVMVLFGLQVVGPTSTNNMTTDNHERPRKRRYEEMTEESEQQNDRMLIPQKRRRIVDEMMEVDGPSGDPARVDNYFFDQDTQEYFFSFIGILQMLRIYYPDIQNEVNLLDLDLNHLMRLYHDVTLSKKNFVQPAAIFQKRLKSLCQNRIVFNRDTVRFPPTVSWPFIQI